MTDGSSGADLPGMDFARREMAARIERAVTTTRDMTFRVEDLEKKLDKGEPEPTDRHVEFTRRWVLAHEPTPEWQRVFSRLEANQLTWRRIVQSQMAMKMEPDVKAAFKSLTTVPPLPRERYQEIVASVAAKFAQPDEVDSVETSVRDTSHDADDGLPDDYYSRWQDDFDASPDE